MDLKQLGKYEIINKLGEGGFGAVYLANNTRLKKRVALKVLHPQVASDDMLAAYFEREAMALARLEHTNIVRVFDYDQIDGVSFIVMEYIDGTALDRLLSNGRTFTLDEIVSIFRQLLSALGYAHENGVIHRDVKPSNIMLTGSGEVKITDFGIAKVVGAAKLTRTGTGAGSLLYMSPEQIKGVGIDNRSDLYSVGVTLYQVVAGKTPFEADSDYEIMTGHLEKTPIAPRQFKSSIAPDLEDVILRALEKKPEKRFQSAQEMSEALGRAKTGSEKTVLSRDDQYARTTAIPRPPRGSRGRRTTLISALAALVAVVIAIWFFTHGGSGEGDSATQNFTDSLASARTLFSQKDYAGAAAMFSALKNSASADQLQKSEVLRYEAASRLLSGDSSTAWHLFDEVQSLDSKAVFPAEQFGTAVAASWNLFNRPKMDSVVAQQGGRVTDTTSGTTSPTSQHQEPATVTGSLAVTVDNYQIFEPVTVIFDGKSRRYEGGAMVFDDLPAGAHEVTVMTDLGRLTKQVQTESGRKECSFTLSEALTSKLTVTCLVADNPDDIVPAQVYIDNQAIEDGQTPFSIKLMNGPHKVWVEDKRYRTDGKPKFVTLSGDAQVEFILKRK